MSTPYETLAKLDRQRKRQHLKDLVVETVTRMITHMLICWALFNFLVPVLAPRYELQHITLVQALWIPVAIRSLGIWWRGTPLMKGKK